MTNLQNDMSALNEMRTKIQRVHDAINEMRSQLSRLRETRKQLEITKMLNYDEFISDLRRTYGHSVDPEAEPIKEQYARFRDTTLRKQDELRSQVEQLRQQLRDKFTNLNRELQAVLNDQIRISGHVKEAVGVVQRGVEELDKPATQLGLEQISGLEQDTKGVYWNKDEF